MIKKTTVLILVLIFILSSMRVMAFEPYRGYNYDSAGNTVNSPNGFTPDRVINGNSMGAGNLNSPHDMFVDRDNREVYIADTGNNRIIVLDYNYKVKRIYSKFNNNGNEETLNNPYGIFVHRNGLIYIADRDNSRVLISDKEGNIVDIVGKPDTELFDKNQTYYPEKIVVDSVGRLYIQAYGIFQGLICIDEKGSFLQYFGSNKVELSAWLIAERLWRAIATREQRSAMMSFVPIEYSNIFIDSQDFVYATVKKSQNSKEEIKKLNPVSNDILNLKQSSSLASNDFGDRDVVVSGNVIIDSSFVDVCVDDIGLIYALDGTRGKVFVYDQERNPLMIFGGIGDQKGLLDIPASIELVDEDVIVLDSKKNSLTVYTLTEFGRNVKKAVELYDNGDYDKAKEPWFNVIKMNANYEMAYVGIGKAYFGEHRFKEAMEYFRLGNDRIGYSEAYNEYRKEVIQQNFYYIFSAIILVFILVWLVLKVKDRRRKEGRPLLDVSEKWKKVLYPFHVMVHPFDGFEGIKFYNEGSLSVSYGILIIWFLLNIIKRQTTGFLFNYYDIQTFNVLSVFSGSVGVFILWVVTNWALCALLDGEGTFRQIFVASAYALVPYIILSIPGIILSNLLTLSESIYLSILNQTSILWCGLLFLIGMMTIHQYTFKNTVKTTVYTLLGMGVVVFIGLLAFSLYQQVWLFVSNIYNEIMFRI